MFSRICLTRSHDVLHWLVIKIFNTNQRQDRINWEQRHFTQKKLEKGRTLRLISTAFSSPCSLCASLWSINFCFGYYESGQMFWSSVLFSRMHTPLVCFITLSKNYKALTVQSSESSSVERWRCRKNKRFSLSCQNVLLRTPNAYSAPFWRVETW